MMDGLSGVASIVAVVTVALQSVSVIHETIGRIRGGPAELRRLDSSLRDLNQVLKQLSALTEDSRQRDAHDYGDLEGSAARCAADVKNMEQTILRFCRKTDERLAGRTWRRIHLALRGDQLREMQERIQHHEQRLVLQLNIFGCNRIEDLKTTVQSSFQKSTAALTQLEVHSLVHRDRLDCLARQRALDDFSERSRFEGYTSKLEELQENATGIREEIVHDKILREQKLDSPDEKHRGIEDLSNQISTLSSISSGQFETLKTMIDQLHSMMATRPIDAHFESRIQDQESQTGTKIASDDTEMPDIIENNDEGLFTYIRRLHDLTQEKSGIKFSDDACSIAENLAKILKVASSQFKPGNPADICRKRMRQDDPEESRPPEQENVQKWRSIKRMRTMLSSSQSVALGGTVHPQRPFLSRSEYSFQSQSAIYETKRTIVQIFCQLRKLREPQKNNRSEVGESKPVETFAATATILPKDQTFPTKFCVSLLQRLTYEGSFSLSPALSCCRIVAFHSPIFDFASSGDLEGLKRLLDGGAASISDCDPYGRSLLSYAYCGDQPRVVQFLIDSGMDVNAQEPKLVLEAPESAVQCKVLNYDGGARSARLSPYFSTPYLPSKLLRYGEPVRLLAQRSENTAVEWPVPAPVDRRECFRLLLAAGADASDYVTSKDLSSLHNEDVDDWRMMLNHDPSLIEERNRFGQTFLLAAATFCCYRDGRERVSLVLSRGADVKARDRRGNTCLHLALGRITKNELDWERNTHRFDNVIHSLKLMIRAGADVYAENDNGQTATQVVTPYNCRSPVTRCWEIALAKCGFDVREVFEQSDISWSSYEFSPGESDSEEYVRKLKLLSSLSRASRRGCRLPTPPKLVWSEEGDEEEVEVE